MLPTGDELEYRVEIFRHPHALRPLLLKNSDSKILSATINLQLKTVAQREVHAIQQGFIPQRQFIQHIARLDAQSRIASNQLDVVTAKPCFIRFDMKAAFPSLARRWLWPVLRRFLLPEGYINAIMTLCENGFVYSRIGHLHVPTGGVVQGCPLSGTPWAMAMDPY